MCRPNTKHTMLVDHGSVTRLDCAESTAAFNTRARHLAEKVCRAPNAASSAQESCFVSIAFASRFEETKCFKTGACEIRRLLLPISG